MRKLVLTVLAICCLCFLSFHARQTLAEPKSSSEHGSGRNAAQPVEGLIVHEWGTFTTFSGSDGVFLDFRPLAAEHSDLPDYVLDRGSYSNARLFSKNRLWGRVRMETPITYFYTDRPQTVNVRVDFPKGLLTEFYPPVREMAPPIDMGNIFGKGESIGNSSLDWGEVDLIPVSELVPGMVDADKRSQIEHDLVKALLPHGPNEKHYAEARDTDSALVHVHGKSSPSTPQSGFFEKFLFYRGVGKFELPIRAEYRGSDLTLSNDGTLPIDSAILIDVDGKSIQAAQMPRIDAGQSQLCDKLNTVSLDELSEMVRQCLVDQGLYEKEAVSMVKTWQQSWFTEQGTRVLYTVPASTTDELLPLHITPSPTETLRVLIGRMEVMSPESEQAMIQAVARSANERARHAATQADQPQKSKFEIPKEVKAFGRMTEPALVRVSRITKDPTIRTEAELLVKQIQSR